MPLAAVGALLGWAALLIQGWISVRRSTPLVGVSGAFINYLGYFTILTNMLGALALTSRLLPAGSRFVRFFLRPTVVTTIAMSIIIVGVVYALLLRGLWDPQGMQLVADILLHYVMPVLFVVYWWLMVPPDALRWSDMPAWLLYPLAYFVFSMLRGASTGIYPYPFVDIDALGFARVLLNALLMLLAFAMVAGLLLAAARLKARVASRTTATG
jgi:hypothetical protein